LHVEKDIHVTIGPRKLLEDVAQTLKENAPSIVLIDGLEFRDAAFPDGNWTLDRLLAAESACRGLPLPADYLVLIGRPQHATVKKKGEIFFYYGFLGLTKVDETGDLSALVVDLENCRPVTIVTASAEGSMVGAGLFYGLFVYPRIDKSVLRGLGQGAAEVLAEARPAGPLRVVVMAAESQEQTNFLEQGRQPKDRGERTP
jgi:hypothetical protein